MRRTLLICCLLFASSSSPALSQAPPSGDSRDYYDLSIPLENPFDSFEANNMAWNGASALLNRGLDLAARELSFPSSIQKRLVHVALSSYFAYATSYYSHEMAHLYQVVRGSREFKVDFSDWSELVPGFVFDDRAWYNTWPSDDVAKTAYVSKDEAIISWMIFGTEAGLYQDEINARSIALQASRHGFMNLNDAAAFLFTHSNAFQYILLHGNEKIKWISTPDDMETGLGANDINYYIDLMSKMDKFLSKDDWLLVSGISFFLSTDTWNSINNISRYLFRRQERTERIRIGIGRKRFIEPPNFYLFATVKGLYVRSETSVGWSGDRGTKQFHILLGTGLDYLGMNGTGKVERMTVGGRYSSIDLPVKRFRFHFTPYGYFDFAGGMKQIGHSVGAEAEVGMGSRFSIYGKIEHNRNDMLEQVIKHKDEGVFYITGLQIKI